MPASPSNVCSAPTLTLTPSKSSLRMKLTTPATASEPYTAEAPPVSTSMFWIREFGIELISTVPPEVVGVTRVPLISTSVRFEPRPRRLTVAVPLPGLFDVRSRPGTVCGNVLSSDSVFTVPVISICSKPTVATGALDVKSFFLMREPVTVISSSSPAPSSCASADGAADNPTRPAFTASASLTAFLTFRFLAMRIPYGFLKNCSRRYIEHAHL